MFSLLHWSFNCAVKTSMEVSSSVLVFSHRLCESRELAGVSIGCMKYTQREDIEKESRDVHAKSKMSSVGEIWRNLLARQAIWDIFMYLMYLSMNGVKSKAKNPEVLKYINVGLG